MAKTDEFDPERAVEVAIGLPLRGRIRTWTDGTPALWEVADPDDFDDLERYACSGAFFTAPYSPGLERETADLDEATRMLVVGKTVGLTHTDPYKGGGTVGEGIFVKLKAATRSRWEASWEDVEKLVVRAAVGAQVRGEVLVIGPGPNPSIDGPSVLVAASTKSAMTYSVLSATPRPSVGSWVEATEDGRDRAKLVASMSPFARNEAANLASAALREWGVDPIDVGIAYLTPIDLLTAPSNELAGQRPG